MSNPSNFNENIEISQMTSEQKLDYLKAMSSGRDPKTGRFLKKHSGNKNGRPPQRTSLQSCMNLVAAQKTTIIINGKKVKTTMIQAACYKIMAQALSSDDTKTLFQIFKLFGSKIDISGELPSSKAASGRKDPLYDESVEKIKRSIYTRLDAERDGTYDTQDDKSETIDQSD